MVRRCFGGVSLGSGMLLPLMIIIERVEKMPEFAQDAKKVRSVSIMRSTY